MANSSPGTSYRRLLGDVTHTSEGVPLGDVNPARPGLIKRYWPYMIAFMFVLGIAMLVYSVQTEPKVGCHDGCHHHLLPPVVLVGSHQCECHFVSLSCVYDHPFAAI